MSYSADALTRAFRLIGETPKDKLESLVADARRVVALPVCEAGKRAAAQALIVAWGIRGN